MAEQRTGLRDDEALVEAIVRGAMSYAAIAREQGVSRACVSQIARGLRRPELHERIVEAQEAMLMQARRLGVACAVQAMAVHIREGIEGKGETARKCREYLINRALGTPGRPAAPAPSAKRREQWPSLLALTEGLFDPAPMMTMRGRDDLDDPEGESRFRRQDEIPARSENGDWLRSAAEVPVPIFAARNQPAHERGEAVGHPSIITNG